MNWDAIGAIGEIIGGVVVVATLVYLAIQAKRTRLTVEAGSTLSTMELMSRWRNAFVESPDLARIAAKANAGENLNAEEQLKFSLFCDEVFFAATVSYTTSHQAGSVHDDEAEIDYILSVIDLIPASITEWNRVHAQLAATAPNLVSIVDQRIGNSLTRHT